MKNNYRKFDTYIGNLENYVYIFQKYFKLLKYLHDYALRIYIDRNITKIAKNNPKLKECLKKINKIDFIEIVVYENKKLQNYESEEKIKYHDGTFGTFIRFIPYLNSEKWKIIGSLDIDLPRASIKEYIKNLIIFEKSSSQYMNNTYLCYNKSWISKTIKYPLMAGMIASKIKFPRNLLNIFFDNNLYTMSHFITSYKNVEYLRDKEIDIIDNLPYGCDEFFLNTSLINYLHKNKIKVYFLIENSIKNFINKLINLKNDQIKKEINIIFNKIAKKEKYSRYIEIDNLDFNLKFIINLESELYNGDTTNEELFFKLLKKIIKYFKENGENFSTNLFKEGINDSCFSNFDKKKTKYYRTKKEMKCLFYSSSCKK